MMRLLKVLIVLLLLVALAAAAGAYWLTQTLEPVAAASTMPTVQPVPFRVESGDSFTKVARTLESSGLIRDARVARWFAETEELASDLKVGEYELSPTQSTPEILRVLTEGRVRTHQVVIPEGLRATEIADRLAAAGLADRDAFLAIALDPKSAERMGVEGNSLEGYLFPDTYRFARGVPEQQIARAMVDQFLAVYRELVPEPENAPLSMLEHTTLASIVEKETGAAHERPLIAAVFLNRMRRGMRLETDPTVIYGIKNFDGNIRRVHLDDKTNPYNTYKIPGLPPGPIASPGRDALRAILNPADSPFLFFVSRNDGTHVFSKTYAEHEAAVDRFQRRRRKK